jgi:type IV pilus assembly protein PilV
MNTHRPQAGFSIVEVMVALMVLAVGMLGIASLYVTSLRSSGSAISRMQAVNLASDLADRIRANRFARTAYENDDPESHDCTDVTDCSEADMAENDVFLWKQQIADVLPGDADGDVVYAAGAPNAPDDYTITVSWTERGSGEGSVDSQLSYTLTMQIDP